MDPYFILAIAGGFVSGFFIALWVCSAAANSCDKDYEKAGVWMIKDRAYQLTPYRKPPVDQR